MKKKSSSLLNKIIAARNFHFDSVMKPLLHTASNCNFRLKKWLVKLPQKTTSWLIFLSMYIQGSYWFVFEYHYFWRKFWAWILKYLQTKVVFCGCFCRICFFKKNLKRGIFFKVVFKNWTGWEAWIDVGTSL